MISVLIFAAVLAGFALAPTVSYAATVTEFSAVGDWGCNSNTEDTVANINVENPDAVLTLGDMSYDSTPDCWFSRVSSIDSKIHIAIGNHDDQDRSTYLSHFGLDKSYYSFDKGNVHFISMDSELSYGVGSAQYNFVKNDLISASQASSIDWIVVYFHQPMYTSPTHHGALASLRDTYHSLFDQYDVDLVLQSHNHNYQRSYPLKYDSVSPTSPTVTSTNANSYMNPDGAIFVTAGTGGQSKYTLDSKASFTQTQFSNVFGALFVTVSSDGDGTTDTDTLSGKFIANGASHTVMDSFTIIKTGDSPPPPPPVSIGYHYEPFFTATGSNYYDVSSSSSLQLPKFSLSVWFKNSEDYSNSYNFIVTRGGLGSDSSGKNMNYGIWLNSAEQLKGGFETASGSDQFVKSPLSYKDGQWHYATLTYSGVDLKLYVDGKLVAEKSVSTSPEIVETTLRVGANPYSSKGYFTGQIDEVRLWSRSASSTEVADQYDGIFYATGQVLRLSFD